MAKDKKKKKDGKKASSAGAKAGKAAKRFKTLTENPLVADVVAAALVATAAALKDSKKARQLAAQAGDQLDALAKEGAERGNAMWELALTIGRRSLDALAGESGGGKRAPSSSKRAPSSSKRAGPSKNGSAPKRGRAGPAKSPKK